MQRLGRFWMLVLGLMLVPASASAELQLKPFGGVTFGGGSPFADLEQVQGKPKLNLGVSSLWLGEIIGVEGEVATTSGFFSGKAKRIPRSHVATITGNVVIAMPRRMTQYTIRPYVVGGVGMAQVSFKDSLESLVYSNTLSAWDIGGGATGFLNDTVALNWDVRLFRTLRPQRPDPSGAVVEEGKLSFWRASMGFSFRL